MINEVLMAENLLNGVGINKKLCLYQHCYLLARYYKQQGLHPIEIRQKIFDWAKKYNCYIKKEDINVNQIITRAQKDTRRLRESVVVRVSTKDIEEIKFRFDDYKVRKAALAILCYAKVTADTDNCFDLPIASLCNWLGYHKSFLYDRCLVELTMFDYFKKIQSRKNQTFTWDNKTVSRSPTYCMLVPLKNIGSHILIDNDIDRLCEECFM